MNILLVGLLESFLQLMGVLVIFVVVLLATYLTTRWLGGLQKGRSHNKNLRIVETIGVGNNKMISIVEAGTRYLVVAVGKDEVRLLAELTQDELKDMSFLTEGKNDVSLESFADIMNKLKEKWPKKLE